MDLINHYIRYASESSEVPAIFHRWSVISGIGAFLGRQYYFEHGHFLIHPNIYCMLLGMSGTRKSSAIKLMKKILRDTGYDTIAADRTTKEKFLLDLAGETGEHDEKSVDKFLDNNLFGNLNTDSDSELFIMADEFNDFFGNGNIEFISLLGTLWDYSGIYTNRIKNGKSVSINNPTISILGGNTPTGFAAAFPTEAIGQGFFSRILLIYGETNGKRIAFPEAPSQDSTQDLIARFRELKLTALGKASIEQTAKKLLEKIYKANFRVDDVRFDAYSSRRFTHLLKLSLITSASHFRSHITEEDIIYANTILVHAEKLMPKALGEFGKAKHSDVSHKIVQLAESANEVLTFREIWRHVASDLEKMQDLSTLIQNLISADKLQAVPGGAGFLPKRKVIEYTDSSLFDMSLLTEEERSITL